MYTYKLWATSVRQMKPHPRRRRRRRRSLEENRVPLLSCFGNRTKSQSSVSVLTGVRRKQKDSAHNIRRNHNPGGFVY